MIYRKYPPRDGMAFFTLHMVMPDKRKAGIKRVFCPEMESRDYHARMLLTARRMLREFVNENYETDPSYLSGCFHR